MEKRLWIVGRGRTMGGGCCSPPRKRGFWIRRTDIKRRWTTKPVKIRNSSTSGGCAESATTSAKATERRERGKGRRGVNVCWNYGRAEILSLTSLCPSWFHGVLHGSRNFFARVTKNCHARPSLEGGRGREVDKGSFERRAVYKMHAHERVYNFTVEEAIGLRRKEGRGGRGNGSREVNSRCGDSVLNAR